MTVELAPPPVSTLAEMQEQNDLLLDEQAQHTEPLPADLVKRIAAFAQQVHLGGAMLDSVRDRRAAQSMLDFWGGVLYRAGNSVSGLRLAKFDESLSPHLPDELCPYVGLRSFEERDFTHFFGRSRLINDILEKIQSHRLVAVVGASGSGKSSVVLSGVIPALRAAAAKDNTPMHSLVMVPGNSPLQSLLEVLHISDHATAADGRKYLVVDQFEELFTLCRDDAVRLEFVTRVMEFTSRQTDKPLAGGYVILTMRTDFEDNVARIPELQAAFDAGRVDVGALGFHELRAAIEQPALQVGLKFDEGIAEDLANTILGERAGLPLLQFTLLRLWENRKKNRITKEAYLRVGNPRQALERSAESFYESLVPENRDVLRRIFTKLVTPNENLEFTSNRLLREEIYTNNVSRDRVDDVLDRLIQARLVKVTGDATAALQVEVAHEALIRNWPRLIEWLEESRENVRYLVRLKDDARKWSRTHDSSLLLRGVQLHSAEQHQSELDDATRAYVQASRLMQDAELAAEQKRERNLIRAEERARLERKRRQQVTMFTIAVSVLLVMALGATFAAYRAIRESQTAQQQTAAALRQELLAHEEAESRRRDAEQSRQLAETANAELATQKLRIEEALRISRSREWATIAVTQIANDPERAILIALKAYQLHPSREAAQALHRSIFSSRLRQRLQNDTVAVKGVAYSHDGRRLAVAGESGRVIIWNVANRTVDVTITGHRNRVTSLGFSPDGQFVVSSSFDGTARVSRVADGKHVLELVGHTGYIHRVRYSRDGRQVVTAGADNTARVWDALTGAPVVTLTGHIGAVTSADFSPGGTTVATASLDGTVGVWDLSTGRLIKRLPLDGAVLDVTYSSDQAIPYLAAGGADREAHVWIASGDYPLVTTYRGHSGWINSLNFSPDNNHIVTGSDDHTAHIWQADGRNTSAVLVLSGHTAGVTAAVFSPTGDHISTGSNDGSSLVWNVTGQHELLAYRGKGDGGFFAVAFSPDGKRVAVSSGEHDASAGRKRSGHVTVLDATSGAVLLHWRAHDDDIDSIAFQGIDHLFTASLDGTIVLWDSRTGTKRSVFDSSPARVFSMAISPDGRLLAAAALDSVHIWDVKTGERVRELKGHSGNIWGLAISPDGKWLGTANDDKTAQLWNLHTGAEASRLTGHSQRVNRVAFSPDSRFMATSSDDGTARLWRVSDGKPIQQYKGHTNTVYGIAFSPDGSQLATGSVDNTVRLWAVESGDEIVSLSETSPVVALAFSPDGSVLASATAKKTVHLWAANANTLLALAQKRVTRPLTLDECERYLKVDQYCKDAK